MTQRGRYLRRLYNITEAEYNEMLWRNHERCPICDKPDTGQMVWVVDHDHKTHRVRGVICTWCNQRVIGRHRDPQLFFNAGSYLEYPPADRVLPPEHRTPALKTKSRKRGTNTGSRVLHQENVTEGGQA